MFHPWVEGQSYANGMMQEFGQILPTARGRPGGGSLLVLGSANVGEVSLAMLISHKSTDTNACDRVFVVT